jgi:glycosyltransferase involved in cell wall biosynthesis
MSRVGVVVIGRNEGERLLHCLRSVVGQCEQLVYVDSGSTDGSVTAARRLGANVVELSTASKFTAARARNAGLARIQTKVDFVQFIDGDCEVHREWLAKATAGLDANPGLGVVCGRRRERFAGTTIYNRLCDLEWDTPTGPTKACGGDAMIRVDALTAVNGYNANLIAGEEPELCVRLRAAGWGIRRIDAEMTLHDAAMTRFSQWWRRNVRNGHAYAEGSAMHGAPPELHWVRETRSNWIWGLLIPLLILAILWPSGGWSAVILLLYPVQALRTFCYARRRWSTRDAMLYGVFCVLGKFPQVIGQLTYCIRTLRGTESTLIEYKPAMEGPSQ